MFEIIMMMFYMILKRTYLIYVMYVISGLFAVYFISGIVACIISLIKGE